MKLIEFSGTKIRGYLDVNIKFYDNLNFLIGTNGSGKTTVLNLINGLLFPSYKILSEIEYGVISLSAMNNEKKLVIISSEREKDRIALSYREGSSEPLKCFFNISSVDVYQTSLFLGESNFERDIVVNKIKEMNGFLSLGIDRQFKYKEINHFFDGNPKKLENLSNLDISLYDVKKKINLEFRRFNAIQSKLGENFKAQILKDSFTFIDDVSFFGSDIEMEPFLKQIEQQEVEFNSIIETYKMKDLTENCKKFFFELKNVVNKLIKWEKGPQKGMEADFLKQILLFGVNRSMLNKINRIVDMGKKNAEAILRSKDRITRFLDATNIFLSETGKRISINSLGEVLIHLPNGQKGNILDLSSGEKHLLIIFSYLIFNENTSSVFVVDEPELSLHIAWQEIFVDTVQKANPNAQLIFATHSPSIIAHKERQKYCIDLAKRN